MPFLLQALSGPAQEQLGGVADSHVGRGLAQQVDRCLLQVRSLPEPDLRRALHSPVDEGSQNGVVIGYADFFQVVERLAHLLATQPRDHHEFVRRYPVIGVRLEQRPHD